MILRPNSVARTADAFRNCGCVTLITIVVMTQMNRLICVAKRIVQLAGRDALGNQTIDASRNGFSAMAKMIVVTTAMSFQKTVLFAKLTQTSSVRTIDAYRNSGLAISLMIAVMVRMSRKHSAKENIEIVQSLSSDATMESVFRAGGDAVSCSNFLILAKCFNCIVICFSRSRRRLR